MKKENKTTKISELQKKVLVYMAESYKANEDFYMYPFHIMADDLKLEIRQIRLACRALTRKGYAEYLRGLFNDEGEVCGSAYGITERGLSFLSEGTIPK